MNRYQIITFCDDLGYDEKEDTTTLKQAKEKSKKYTDIYESVYIYDKLKLKKTKIN